MAVAATRAQERVNAGGVGHLEADVPIALGRVQAVRQSWSEPIDSVGVSEHHWLQLSLLPTTHTERGRFPEHWEPHHFERIGEVFMLPAGRPVHAKSECRTQVSVACAFDPVATETWLGEELEWTDLRLKGSLDLVNPTIRGLLFRLGEEIRNPGFASETLVELMAGQVAVELGRHFRAIREGRATGGLSPWRLRLIDERLADGGDPPALSELAALVGLSVRQMARGFRISRGCSIGGYVAASRIEQAKRLLASSQCVKSVAYELGFRSPSNFTVAFRRVTGETPRAYQQRAMRPTALAASRRPRRG